MVRSKADGLHFLAIAYLALPAVAVELGWLTPWIGVPLALLTLWCVLPDFERTAKIPAARLIVLALAAIIVVALSGTSPLIEGVAFIDLVKHRLIYNDLVKHDWPVIFQSTQSPEILRYGIGFYVVPALLSKLIGQPSQFLFCAWMALGVLLFLLLATRETKNPAWIAAIVLIVLFFGGLDFIGLDIIKSDFIHWVHPHPKGTEAELYIEEWMRFPHGWIMGAQSYSLSWMPQHAVAAWLGASLLYQGWDKPWFMKRAAGIFTVLAFWSPFTALSFAIIVAALHLRNIPSLLSARNIAALIPLALLAAYYSLGPFLQEKWTTLGDMPLAEFVGRYALFVMLEFGVFALAAYAARRAIEPPAAAAVGLLLAMPFFKVGLCNEIMLHGSMLPITLVILNTIEGLRTPERHASRAILGIMVFIGVFSGFGEAVGMAIRPQTPGDYSTSITSMVPKARSQYVAPLPESASWLLRR
ncbi:MAG: hypothetical protein WDO70_10355 [Alphaproteobacteria bacterium]